MNDHESLISFFGLLNNKIIEETGTWQETETSRQSQQLLLYGAPTPRQTC